MILNLHRRRTTNIGDLRSAPYLYFDFLSQSQALELRGHLNSDSDDQEARDRWEQCVRSADHIVIGGGGLIGIDFFSPSLHRVFRQKKPSGKVYLWGVGHNCWQIGDWREIKYRVDLSDLPFHRVGLRDSNQAYPWVPCASCMDPLFDAMVNVDIEREVGLFLHENTLVNPDMRRRLPDIPGALTNDSDFRTTIRYLATSETVLTDSYHGMYWATLLGRKVVAFPTSSKFYDWEFPAPLCAPQDWRRFAPLAQTYPDALERSRQANMAYASELRALVE